MGGEDGEAGIIEAGQRHQRVVLRALAADLVAVGAGGLVAVVAVGDQQLGIGEALVTAARTAGSATRQTRLTVPFSSVTSPQGSAG